MQHQRAASGDYDQRTTRQGLQSRVSVPASGQRAGQAPFYSLRSPSIRAAPEDSLQEDLPDEIEFLSLDPPTFSERDDEDDDGDDVDSLKLEEIDEGEEDEDEEDEDDDDDDEVESNEHSSGSSSNIESLAEGDETMIDDDMKDWPEDSVDSGPADEAVHLEGLPRSTQRLPARSYRSPEFATNLLRLLRSELAVPGWSALPERSGDSQQMNVHKVSGSLTNAVFFISFPMPELHSQEAQQQSASGGMPPSSSPLPPPTVLLRIYGPSSGNLISRKKELHVLNTLSAQYGIGPAILGTFANGRVEEFFESRALYKEEMRLPRTSRWIARRMRELHSVDLNVMELSPEKASRRSKSKMIKRTLDHFGGSGGSNDGSNSSRESSVEPVLPSSTDFSKSPEPSPSLMNGGTATPLSRPSPVPCQTQEQHPSASGLSTSSASSVGSFASYYSSSSAGTNGLASPRLSARHDSRPGVSEARAPQKKRSHSTLGSRPSFSLDPLLNNQIADAQRRQSQSSRAGSSSSIPSQSPSLSPAPSRNSQTHHIKPKSVVWENIDSWTREARKVLKKVKKLSVLMQILAIPEQEKASSVRACEEDMNPLHAPSLLLACRKSLDIKTFRKEIKKYKRFVKTWEAEHGKSKRVFAHNDTQCGNLLRLTPGGTEDMVQGLRAPHEMIIVVDFEYAGVNPRGFDIANHFLEWQTDYHHPTLSHSVTKHSSFPSQLERQRFYRAYIPCDGGFDAPDSIPAASGQSNGSQLQSRGEPPIPLLNQDDTRVQRLEEEVKLWTAASHAMYTVWSIVQATDDIKTRIDQWIKDPAGAREAEKRAMEYGVRKAARLQAGAAETTRPKLERGKSGEEIHHTGENVAASTEDTEDAIDPPLLGDFDYCGYALERVVCFREELGKLGVA